VARLLADSFTSSLHVEVDLTVIPPEQLLAAQHALVEKVLPLPFDVLVHAWLTVPRTRHRRCCTASSSTPPAPSGPARRSRSSRS
jgi:hypothetical protein